MAVDSQHPEFAEALADWVLMRDSYKGERRVKQKGTLYLPHTQNQKDDGVHNENQAGWIDYVAYRMRARYPMFVREAVQSAVGMMHSQEAEIKLPAAMEGIRSVKGHNLQQILRKINEQQLLVGRVGLLLDLPKQAPAGEDLPYIATYHAERIINWDDGSMSELVPQKANMFVLDESEFVRDADFQWVSRKKHRILSLGPLSTNEGSGVTYKFGVFSEKDVPEDGKMAEASWRGNTLDHIPFVVINSSDIALEVDEPPLLDLGNLCMTMYRGDADYRQNLFMQGQDTLVIRGATGGDEEEPVRIGSGSRIDIPNPQGGAEFIGVSGDGLEEQRLAQGNLEQRAGTMGAQTLDSTSRERESGASMNIRVAARTADLNQIARAGAYGLETLLKSAAKWMGENPAEVSIRPNLEFGGSELTGQDMVQLQTSRNLGYPISARSLHEFAYRKKITTRSFEEEMEQAQKEKGTIFAPALTGDRDPFQTAGGGGREGSRS